MKHKPFKTLSNYTKQLKEHITTNCVCNIRGSLANAPNYGRHP